LGKEIITTTRRRLILLKAKAKNQTEKKNPKEIE
jgi:hypothetical protein